MDDIERVKRLADARKHQLERQNQHQKDNYKRASVLIRNEVYQEILARYPNTSINGYINELIKRDLNLK